MKTLLLRKSLLVFLFLIFNTVSWSQISDDFTDGNFTSSPVWSGDTGSFAVSTAATLPSGTAATDGFFLASNASTGNIALTTPSTETSEWAFSLGSPNFAPSTANYIGVILMSSAAVTGSVATANWSGYYLRIGIDGSTDPIELWKKAGAGAAVKVGNFPSSANYGATALTAGLNIRVTRNSSGQFELFYSTGFTYAAAPTTSAGTLTDNTVTTSSYFGVYQVLANPAASRRVYIDNVVIGNPAGNVAPVASSVTFTGTLEVGQLLTGSYSYSDANSDPEGTSTFRWFRADDAAGFNEVAIPSATSSTYTLGSSDNGKFISFGVTPIASTGTTTGAEVKSSRQGPVTALNNSVSTITYDGTFTPSANVNYSSFTGTDVTGSSYQIARFNLNDVAGTPDDGFTTTLTGLTFGLTNSSTIDKIALYDDTNTEIQEVTAAATVNFTGLSIVAASGASKSFSVRLTFKTIVTDNAQPHLTISAATAHAGGSLFAAANAGGAGSSITGDNNRIEVTASALAYGTNASTTVLNTAMAPSVTVRAIDANTNLDLDYTAAVDITSTGTLSASPVSVNAVAGVATFAAITHTVSGLGLHLTAASGAFTPINSSNFDIYNPIFANTITGTNPNNSNPYTTGQVVDPNITATGIGRGSGITGTSASDRYNANAWNSPTFDANKYFTFSLTPNPSKEINFVNLIYTAQISGVGALTGYEVRSSIDNFTAAIGTPTAGVSPGATVVIDLSAPEFQNVATSITFRIYGWGASVNTSTFSINNFSFNGEVTNSTAPNITASVTSLTNLDYFIAGGPSSSQTFTVDAANLSPGDDVVTVSVTSDFEVSSDNVTFDSSATIGYTAGSITAAPVYVRLAGGLGLGTYNGTVTVSGGTAPSDTVGIQGVVRVPFTIPYSNTFRTTAANSDASAQGFVLNNTVFNATGYDQISINGYIETPVIDFTQQTDLEVYFDGATFGGNTNQTLELQISTNGGTSYTPLQQVTYLSSTFLTTRILVDVSAYPSVNGKLRVQMVSGTNTTRFRDFVIADYTVWEDQAWSNGEPTAVKVAVFEDDYSGSGLFSARHLILNAGDVSFENGATVSLQDEITVNGGSLTLQSNANLLQANTLFANSGAINVERQVSIRRLDYVYWSSPVSNQLLDTFSEDTLNERFYTLDEPTNSFAWINPETNNFVAAKGYMVRAPNTFTTALANFYGVFTGVPHNGNQSLAGTSLDASHGFNMIGNPYPSPINITTFKAANPSVGTLYFWTHFSQDPGASNYATYTSTGAAGANGIIPNGTIQIGQGFIAKLSAAATLSFTNAMRVDNHQNQFFRTASENEPERHRFWLNLSKENTNYNQILLGYVEGATNGVDFDYDGKAIENNPTLLYNKIANENYIVQGKALPFQDTDVVALGFKAAEAGNYTISLANFDGIFANGQHIYIKDNLTGATHEISESAYGFASLAGTFDSRFEVVYQATLGIENPTLDANSVIIFKKEGALHIDAGTALISDVKVFDIQGRLVYQKNVEAASSVTLNGLKATNQVLLVQVTSNNGGTITKKVMN